MDNLLSRAYEIKSNIDRSGLSIYDDIEMNDPDLWYSGAELEALLLDQVLGHSFEGLPLRTRSKKAKDLVCQSLGYFPPKSYSKTTPRFLGQKFDLYVQKSNNLQVWNEELDSERRYVLFRLDEIDQITNVKVVNGAALAKLDTTGTLTQKYQATLDVGRRTHELISSSDTDVMCSLVSSRNLPLSFCSPIDTPEFNSLYSIEALFVKLSNIVGQSFDNVGAVQERIRGDELHRLVCESLGYGSFGDNGQFPDVKHQLLEVKLQTSATIDLGLVCPDSTNVLDIEPINEQSVRHCDVRYAVFKAEIIGNKVVVTNLFLTTGADFFTRFRKFEGKGLNKKLQIPLPRNFFELNVN